MALIDVIRYQSEEELIVWKYPSLQLKLGSQLVVNTSQKAFFVKGGQILDEFNPGTTTLVTGNIPLLNKLINLPFGGDSPFQAEVWFVNLISKLDNKWGTPAPIQLEDPKYNVIVPVRAFGQFGLSIDNPRRLLESLVGNMSEFNNEKILEYFKGKIISSFTSAIGKKIIHESISVLEMHALLDELSEYCRDKIREEFSKYGIRVDNFYIMSLNIPENDQSVVKLKEAKDLAARVKITGKDVYQMDRSFDVLDKAAQNEGSIAGNLIGAGLGLGAGLGIGSQMSHLSQNLSTNNPPQPPLPPPIPQQVMYHVLINGQQEGPIGLAAVAEQIQRHIILKETLVWKPGMENWDVAGNQIDLVTYFNSTPPKPPI